MYFRALDSLTEILGLYPDIELYMKVIKIPFVIFITNIAFISTGLNPGTVP